MRSTLTPARSPRAWLLYLGVAIFVVVAALTARAIWIAWDQRAGQARTAAVFELVEQRIASRPVEAPGATAWLRRQLAEYRTHLPVADRAAFERLAMDADRAPSELDGAAAVMRAVAATLGRRLIEPKAVSVPSAVGARRSVAFLDESGERFVITRRQLLELDAASNRFVGRLAPAMARTMTRLSAAVGSLARPVRLYALAEDGTLVSLPSSASQDAEEVAHHEALQLSSRPTLPSFAPEEFFFRFAAGDEDAVRYSGFYVDLGGRGLVSTLTMPLTLPEQAGVLALDLSHAIDWDHFASTIPAPLAATIIHTAPGAPDTWQALRASLADSASAPIRAALDGILAEAGPRDRRLEPISHAVVGELGAVAAFHVSDGAWLLTFFPSVAPSFPFGAVVLLGAVLAMLLVGFEANRRRAEREADRAARALGEKQNILNTMQVPLVVVDPNTDEIVSANQIAESIGIRRGARFADRVGSDPRARAHYERTQVATESARRAYGVPIRIENERGEAADQFALVRSVAVTAPIEALSADERHRLAILFLVEPESDLRLLLDDVESRAHTDERRRLSGFLSHGVDSLADVLRRRLGVEAPAESSTAWLAEYLQRRIHVTAWLLDHWDAPPPPHDAVVDAPQARETVRSLERIFTAVRDDGDLRGRLGWTNGPLARGGSEPPFAATIDWPEEFETTLPVRGGLGFFLTEVLSNAMRHGAAASTPRLSIACDRVRRELTFVVENDRRDEPLRSGSRYGGLSLLAGMARLFGWREFAAGPAGTSFSVSWVAPLTRRDRPGRPD